MAVSKTFTHDGYTLNYTLDASVIQYKLTVTGLTTTYSTALRIVIKFGSTTVYSGIGTTNVCKGTVVAIERGLSDSETVTVSMAVGGNAASTQTTTAYKVYLNPNGGSGYTELFTKWHGTTMALPNPTLSGFTPPTKSGYNFLGYNTTPGANATLSSYTANQSTTLYAVWEPCITGVSVSLHTVRVADTSSVLEADEGDICYGVCSYTVTGAAYAQILFNISVDPIGPVFSQPAGTTKPYSTNTFTGSFAFYATNCSTDSSYQFAVQVTARYQTYAGTIAEVTNSGGDKLSVAYYPLDVLGDAYYYNLTEDTAIDSSKTYYTRTGDGSVVSPFVYTVVEAPDVSEIGNYYEANGERPAHGISFGAPCKREGFHVCMAADFGRAAGNVALPDGAMENGYIRQFTNGWDYSQPRSTDQSSPDYGNYFGSSLETFDNAGHRTSYLQSTRTSTGVYRSIAASNPRTGGSTAIYLYANDDNSHSATMTSGTAWPIANGGTGATSAADARTNLGLKTLATKSSATVTNSRGAVSGSATNSSAISSGSTYSYEFTVTIPSGYMYTGIGRIGRSGTGNGNLDIAGFNTNTSGQTVTCTIAMHNHGSSSVSKNAVTCTVECCYIKTNPSISFSS